MKGHWIRPTSPFDEVVCLSLNKFVFLTLLSRLAGDNENGFGPSSAGDTPL